MLRLTVDGVERYYTDAAISIPDSTPGTVGEIQTLPGMTEPDMVDALGEGGASLGIEILDPANWSAIIKGLSGAPAEVSQIIEGQDWTVRRVILRGRVDSPVYGAAGEPIRFGLQSAPWQDRGLLPLPSWVVSDATWPRATSALACPGDLHGLFYPVVIGDPGADASATTEADWYPLPALIVEIDDSIDPPDNSAASCVVLLGAGVLGCVGDTVEVYNETTGASAGVSPFITTDAAGVDVTCVEIAAADMPVVMGDALFWRPSSGGKAGIAGTSTAGGAIRWLLSWSSAEVDPGLMQSAADRLNRWRVGAYIDEPVSPYQWVQDNLFSVLPVMMVEGPAGIGLAILPVLPADADGAETVDVEAVGGERASEVAESSWRDISTSLSLQYAPDDRLGTYRRRIDLDPTISRVVGTRHPTPYGRAAAQLLPGLRPLDLTFDAVSEPATATALAEYHLRQAAQTSREVDVTLPQAYQTLQAGDLLRVTLADVGWSEVLCVVVSVPRISGAGVFRLRTIPDIVRAI